MRTSQGPAGPSAQARRRGARNLADCRAVANRSRWAGRAGQDAAAGSRDLFGGHASRSGDWRNVLATARELRTWPAGAAAITAS